jgi:hypothetical protein
MYACMRRTLLPLAILLSLSSCWERWGNPDEPKAPIDAACVSATAISIDSFPTSKPVTTDVEVLGTITGDPSTVTKMYLGTRDTSRSISAMPAATWHAVVPLSVLLEPNQGPGLVSIVVTAEASCPGARDAGMQLKASSKEFIVDFAPIPIDAGTDAVGLDASM